MIIIDTLFVEFYWFGVFLAAFVVLAYLTVRSVCSEKENSIKSLLWFLASLGSWYFVTVFFIWFVLKFIYYMLGWCISTIKSELNI